jgi:uncharacterized protein YdaT
MNTTVQHKAKHSEGLMSKGKDQHVVPHDGSWAVRGEGNTRVTSTHGTQAAAIDRARGIAQHQESEVVIHNRRGQIRDSDSYGNDPCPPKDRKH